MQVKLRAAALASAIKAYALLLTIWLVVLLQLLVLQASKPMLRHGIQPLSSHAIFGRAPCKYLNIVVHCCSKLPRVKGELVGCVVCSA